MRTIFILAVIIIFSIFLFMWLLFGGVKDNAVACTEEAKLCSDGRAVGRILPDCEFEVCPTECRVDSDCACGSHIETNECFIGNKKYVDITKQCPGFCTGINKDFLIECIDKECKIKK